MVDVKSIDITQWIDQNVTGTRSQEDWRGHTQGLTSRRTGILLLSTFGNGPVRRISVEHFWTPFNHCIEYALRLEGKQRDLHIAILNEIVKENAQRWTREPADAEKLLQLLGNR